MAKARKPPINSRRKKFYIHFLYALAKVRLHPVPDKFYINLEEIPDEEAGGLGANTTAGDDWGAGDVAQPR